MVDKEFRQKMLGSKKTERIIFAATPELKRAIEAVAKDQCVSASALITDAVVEELGRHADVISQRAEG